MQMVEAAEKVDTAREKEIAERRKLIELVGASQQAERDAIRLTTAAAAESRAATDRGNAQIVAAEAAKVRYQIDADGRRLLNEAENMRSEASRRSALQAELIQNLPSIIRESVKPMENIDSIKILQVEGMPGFSGAPGNGGGAGRDEGTGPRNVNLAETAVNSALRYRAQVPFVDGLLREIGMSSGAISSPGGLTIFPVGDGEPEGAERRG